MNVDTFQNDPSIKWYFIAAIPFMIGVVAFYFFMKRGSSLDNRPSPHQRAVYESFFREMSETNPTLWSRNGPRDYVHVSGAAARIKWSLIKHWIRRANLSTNNSSSMNNATTMTPGAALVSDAEDAISGRAFLQGDGTGTFSRIQRYFSRRWTSQIAKRATAMPTADTELALMNLNSDLEDLTSVSGDERLSGDHATHHNDNTHAFGEGLTEIAQILSAPAVPSSGHPGVFSYSAPGSVDHDRDHLTVPGASARTTSSSPIPAAAAEPHDESGNENNAADISANPIIAAAQRLRSSSSPRPRSSGGGSSGGRNSRNSDRGGVLVEEEDAEWLNERGRKGKAWLWRRSLSSRGSRGSSGRDA